MDLSHQQVKTYRLLQTDSQINNGDVGGGDTESHASEFAARKKVRKAYV